MNRKYKFTKSYVHPPASGSGQEFGGGGGGGGSGSGSGGGNRYTNNNRRFGFGGHSSYNDDHDSRYNDNNNNNNNNINTHHKRGGRRNFSKSHRNPRDLRSNIRSHLGINNNNQNQNNNNNNKSNREMEDTFKITIPYGEKYEKTYLMNLIRQNFDNTNDNTNETSNIIFYNYRNQQNSAIFYVIGVDAADTLRNLSRRITTHTGQRLVIISQRAPLPVAPLDEKCQQLIKLAMSRLYDPTTCVMNLTKFRDAEEFRSNGIFIAIGRANILKAIVEIIKENTPNIVALNLSSNKLNSLEMLRSLGDVCGSIKAIDLSKNKIHSPTEIENLKDLDLIELVLDGNPMCDTFTSHEVYISSIRKHFKNLKKLDNEDLPAEIGFDLGEQSNIPEEKCSYLPEEMKTFVYGFLEAFYNIYDSDNRQPLIQAYHDSAMFTMSIAKHDNSKSYEQLIKESHNLLRLRDESHWVKLVKQSNVEVVATLCKMPSTKHDPQSFKIDVPFRTGNFVNLVVTGLFRETFRNNQPLKTFCRTFFIVPQGSGFVIVNDMLEISSPSVKQTMKNKNTVQQQSSKSGEKIIRDVEFTSNTATITTSFGSRSGSSNLPSSSSSNGSMTVGATPTVPLSPQEEIVLKFMQITGMNREFAMKCLQENGFNPDVALDVFNKLHSMNALPPEAFVR